MRGGSSRIRRSVLAASVLMVTMSGCGQAVSGTPIAAETGASGEGLELASIAGVWTGSYTCAQGDTDLTLTVESSGRTEFEFSSAQTGADAEEGSFAMEASVAGEQVEFDQVAWITQPEGYVMVDLVATDITDDSMSGTVDGAGCSTFRVRRDDS